LPQKVDPKLFRSRKSVDVLRILTDLKRKRDPGRFLDEFEPRNPHYQALKFMLTRYRGLAEQGFWPNIAQGESLKVGMSDLRIPRIRNLLAMTGDFVWKADASPIYDPQLEIAVRGFQQRHGLEAKGLIGKQTVIAMTVPPAERARQIMLNMERWRWMPENLGDYHIMVNLAAFELQEVQSSVIVDRMNVVVGAVATQTPHNIYLHDTPARGKFSATSRAFSHGCIRLSRPLDFAYRIVGNIAGWNKARIDAAIAGGRTTQVPLPRRIPVHLIYATAFKGENGIEFRPDVYGRDRKLYAALYGRPES
jgi:murein L,D-transpeptidase YcbB/YkuD